MNVFAISIFSSLVISTHAYHASDFLVEGLEKIEPNYAKFDGKMYAGLLPIDIEESGKENEEKRGELMFWMFQANKDLDSITIWLNGGPGCSSFSAGNFFETAPVTSPHYRAGYPKTSYDEPFTHNKWAWTRATNMMFIEQPTNVGFSWGPTVTDEADLSQDFYNFLQNFFTTFPDMATKKLFIFGESYAGMYVPSIAHKIHTENVKGEHRTINLSGIALGNGWMDAMGQGSAVIDYAYWHGMIDSPTRANLFEAWDACKAGDKLDPPLHDFNVPDECNIMGATMQAAGAGLFPDKIPNVYDVTTWDTYPILNDANNTFDVFMSNPEVRKALNVPDYITVPWMGCIPGAGRRLEEELLPGKTLLVHDKPESVVPYVAELLDEAGIRVLIYNGDRDISVCAQGSEKLLDEMNWDGANGWKNEAKRGLWMVEDNMAGYAKTYGKLDFVIVYNSGHLVPNNVPVPALDLITRFVNDEAYMDVEIPAFEGLSKGNRARSRHQWFHSILLLTVAIVCFVSGMLAASCWNRRRSGYSSIPTNVQTT
ncbi:unnamed protein product [Cylindrotheca closterium]|uniref:Carboxypeptidase n=1 Tax=Cylindrotheca closterium TaxID=2856 RepID=A0AAD2CLB9_9STRA|nr:unnamed protein product [Cylindrotheca closterium]